MSCIAYFCEKVKLIVTSDIFAIEQNGTEVEDFFKLIHAVKEFVLGFMFFASTFCNYSIRFDKNGGDKSVRINRYRSRLCYSILLSNYHYHSNRYIKTHPPS